MFSILEWHFHSIKVIKWDLKIDLERELETHREKERERERGIKYNEKDWEC